MRYMSTVAFRGLATLACLLLVSTTIAATPQAMFDVRASQISSGKWYPTTLQAAEGQQVLVKVTTSDGLTGAIDRKGESPQIEFRIEGSNKSLCCLRLDRAAKAGQTKTETFVTPTSGRVQYSTKGKFSVKVTMTLSDPQPNGAAQANSGNRVSISPDDTPISTVTPEQAENGLSLAKWTWKHLAEEYGIRTASMTGRVTLPSNYYRFFQANLGGKGYVSDGETIKIGRLQSDTIELIQFNVEFVNKAGLVMVQSGKVYVGYGNNSASATLQEIEAPGIGSMDGTFTVTKSLQERMIGDALNKLGR